MSAPSAPPTRDYSAVTEVTGEAVRRDAHEKMGARYAFAAARAAGRDVLEVACGSAQGLGLIARTARRTVGGDYTFALVRDAARHYGRRVGFVCLDGQRLPFPDRSFDLVLCYEALYYFPDAQLFLAEAARVLRSGGELVIVNVNPRWGGFNPSPHSTRYHDSEELRALLSGAGFSADVRGAFVEEEAGVASRLIGIVRRIAVTFHLVPKTMTGKRLLKRLFYGRLVPLPPELADGTLPTLHALADDGRSTVLYAVGRR